MIKNIVDMLNGMTTSNGIVLVQPRPGSSIIVLLDQALGRIDSLFFYAKVCVGSLMQYSVQQRNGKYFIDNATMIDIPLFLARADLLFLHHVLELLYHFIPVGSCTMGVFELLLLLYAHDQRMYSMRFKKFFLFKLLSILGIYPENMSLSTRSLQMLLTESIDKINDESIDLECEKDLDNWLYYCVAEHPRINDFKTIHFLNRIG